MNMERLTVFPVLARFAEAMEGGGRWLEKRAGQRGDFTRSRFVLQCLGQAARVILQVK